jgi:hypothetical protein
MKYDERYTYLQNDKYLDQMFLKIVDDSETSQMRLADMYHNSDFVPWGLLFAAVSLFSCFTFMIFKYLRETLLDWNDLIEKKPASPDEEKKAREDMSDEIVQDKAFFKLIFVDNWWVFLVIYQCLDPDFIYPTGFEYLVFYLSYAVQTHVQAMKALTDDFV